MPIHSALEVLEADKTVKYRMAFGKTEDGGVEDVVTGLSTVVDCGCTLADVPTLANHYTSVTPRTQTGAFWGQIRIRHFGSAAAGDATPATDSTAIDTHWWAIGT